MEIPFDCDSHKVDGVNLSYLDSGGNKPPLHLYHANGFPISVYLPLMTDLIDDFRVVGLGLRGQDAQTEGNTSWHRVAYDLIDFLDAKNLGPVLGVGHSVGGVATMMAAALRPDLFTKIILIDPVMVASWQLLALAALRITGKKHKFFLAKMARERKESWTDRQQAYDYFKTKSLFKRFDDAYLRSYVTYGLKPTNDHQVELLCPPEAEARIFENYPLDIWSWPKRLEIPVLVIQGEYSDVLKVNAINRFKSLCKQSKIFTVKDAGHLIPMEKPAELVSIIKDFSKENDLESGLPEP